MATRVIDDTKLQNIAVAIQGKDSGGTMTVDEMPTRIAAIQTGDEVLFSSDGRQYTRTVEIPDGVTTLGEYAFYRCTGLTEITFPNSLTTIGRNAWDGKGVFIGCTSLTEIDFKNVTSIGRQTFYECTGLTEIDFKNVISIGESAFEKCTSLTETDFKNVTSIGQASFRNCTRLTEIDLKNMTTLNGSYHFTDCSSLTKAVGKKVTSTAHSFYNCSVLQTAILPVAATVGQNTFLGDRALKNVDCRNVGRIVQGAFKNCSRLNLIDLTSRTTPTTLDTTDAFNSTNNTWIAVVADDTIKNDFQNATNWSTFASHFRTIAEVEAEVGMTYDEYYYQLFGEPRNEVTI